MNGILSAVTITLAQAAGGADSDSGEQAVSLLGIIHSGGLVGYLIILLSFAAFALVVMHGLQIRRSAVLPADLLDELEVMLGGDRVDVEGAERLCDEPENQSFLTRVLGAGLRRARQSAFGALELRGAIEESAQAEVARMYRSTDGLALIAAIAPMMGLLGTVVGITGAFNKIASTDTAANPSIFAGNINQALTTTIMGLVLAIPAQAAVTWFRNRIDGLAVEAGNEVERLAANIEKQAEA